MHKWTAGGNKYLLLLNGSNYAVDLTLILREAGMSGSTLDEESRVDRTYKFQAASKNANGIKLLKIVMLCVSVLC